MTFGYRKTLYPINISSIGAPQLETARGQKREREMSGLNSKLNVIQRTDLMSRVTYSTVTRIAIFTVTAREKFRLRRQKYALDNNLDPFNSVGTWVWFCRCLGWQPYSRFARGCVSSADRPVGNRPAAGVAAQLESSVTLYLCKHRAVLCRCFLLPEHRCARKRTRAYLRLAGLGTARKCRESSHCR